MPTEVQPKAQAVASGKARLAYMDIARGIAMVCIVAGHFGIATINRVVYTFHVPLFFLMSGFFFSVKGTWTEFLLGKAKQLLLPYLIGCVGIFAASFIYFAAVGWLPEFPPRALYIIEASLWGAGTYHEAPLVVHQIGALWFLPALFFGYCTLRAAVGTRFPLAVVLAAAVLGWLSSRFFWLPLSLQPGMFCSLFLYLGYAVRQRQLLRYLSSCRGLAVAAVALMLWGYCVYRGTAINVVEVGVNGGLIAFVGALAGSYVMVVTSFALERFIRPIARFFNYYGQSTLGILVFHAMADFVWPWGHLYGLLGSFGWVGAPAHLVVLGVNVLWPLLGLAVVRLAAPPLYRVLVPRAPTPLPPAAKVG